jgi:hypothetical protein
MRPGNRIRERLPAHGGACAILAMATALLAAPVAAQGAGTYVDQGTGSDTANDCSDQANPCKTVLRGISQAPAGATVHVAGGHTYTAALTLGDGKSLVHTNFGGASGEAILDNGASAQPEVTVDSSAGRIKGFTIRSENLPVELDASAKLTNDRFDQQMISEEVHISPSVGGHPKVLNDAFIGRAQMGVLDESSAPVTISHDNFKGFNAAVDVDDSGSYPDPPTANVTIDDNRITGAFGGGEGGFGIWLRAARRAVVDRNRITDPDFSGSSSYVVGIDSTAGHLFASRNVVLGHSRGVVALAGKVKLDDDLIASSAPSASGLYLSNLSKAAEATNLTLETVDFAAELAHANLSLDSSIVGAGGISAGAGANCTISYSDGPTKHPGGDGCKAFQTTANPKFQNAAADNYRLKGSSPLIDKGNPSSPPAGTKDVYGQKRVLAGDCSARHPKKRRDIGAAEFRCPKHKRAGA